MDLGRILQRAWNITWHYKILWLFGFLVMLASGAGGGGRGGTGMQYTWRGPIREPLSWGWITALALFVLLAILIGLALLVLSIIARGALIDGVRQAEEQGSVSGRAAWQTGLAHFWSLLGITVLLFLAILALVVVLALPVVFLLGLGAFASGAKEISLLALIPAFCGIAICIIPLVLVGLALNLIRLYAERVCVLEGLGTVESIKRGWETLKNNVGITLVAGAILLAISAVIAAIFFGGVVSIALPGLAIWRSTRNLWATAVPMCGLGALMLLASLLVGAILQTFNSAVWTLIYREIPKRDAAAPTSG